MELVKIANGSNPQLKSKQLSSEVRLPVRKEAQTGRGAAVGSSLWVPPCFKPF